MQAKAKGSPRARRKAARTHAGDAAHGVLPLVAERAPSLELPVWACGASRWAPSLGGLTIPFIIPFKSLTTYSNCTTIYCTILLFEYALITIRETASFSEGCSRVCLLGPHAATSPRLPVLVPLSSYFTCSFDQYRYMYRYLI